MAGGMFPVLHTWPARRHRDELKFGWLSLIPGLSAMQLSFSFFSLSPSETCADGRSDPPCGTGPKLRQAFNLHDIGSEGALIADRDCPHARLRVRPERTTLPTVFNPVCPLSVL